MFDEVTKLEGGKRAARKGAYIFGSTLFQALFVAVLILVGERLRAAAKTETVVDVKFVRAVPPPPPPPPAPPAPKRKAEAKPKSEVAPKPPPPTAMIQPKDVAEEMKAPNPNEPPEPEPEVDAGGSGGGVVGGVVGAGIEEAPQYMMAGFRRPQEKQRDCVRNAMRVPPSLAGFVSGAITVKFAVRRDGSVSQVQIMSQVPDPRIGDIIRKGLTSCEWTPGADAQGRPTNLWVIMPIRFAGG